MGQIASHISGYFSDAKENIKKPCTLVDRNICSEKESKNSEWKDASTKSFFSFDLLATPRIHLKRTRQTSPDTSLPQAIIDIISPPKRAKLEDKYLEFPFLNDEDTINYYKKSKIMIILRGLPGSGKSTIAKQIQSKFAMSEVCSADLFFMQDGKYKYDRNFIKDAHTYCQENAVRAVQKQTAVVIIDNTNVKSWEMKFYHELAHEFNYIPVVVEAQTPWRRDVAALVSKTVHSIPEDIMRYKVDSFDALQPLYYGWFLNESDSFTVSEIGQTWLEKAYKLLQFKKDFLNLIDIETLQELLDYFIKPGRGHVLHCTSKYVGKRRTPDAVEYMEKNECFIGKAFDIEVVAFVVTPRTFGARVSLPESQLHLWDKDDYEDVPAEFWDFGSEEPMKSLHQESENAAQVLHNGNLHENDRSLSINGISDDIAVQDNLEAKNKADFKSDKAFVETRSKRQRAEQAESHPPVDGQDVRAEGALVNCNGISQDSNMQIENSDKHSSAGRDPLNTSSGSDSLMLKLNESLNENLIERPISHKKTFDHSQSSESVLNSYSSCDSRTVPASKATPKSPKKKGDVIIPENTLDIENTLTRETVKNEPNRISGIDGTRISPLGTGSRAHFTLGCAPSVRPVTTGLDLLMAAQKETEMDSLSRNNTVHNYYSFCFTVEGGSVVNYGNGVWVMYPEQKLVAKSVFSAKF